MDDTFEIGCCYQVTLPDGQTITFRFMGGNPLQAEVPPGSQIFQNFESLFSVYIDVKKVPCP
jgi:hypothetical protein